MKKFTLSLIVLSFLVVGVANAAVYGCMDKKAWNYNANATIQDNSCEYMKANGNPLAVYQPAFGLTGLQIIAKGWTWKPGEGECPIWYHWGCFGKR